MAWSQADVDALDQALKAGAKRVRFSDQREVEYHSLDEMLKLREAMVAVVASSSGSGRASSTLAQFTKGL
jgi:hypothetical protein